MVPLPFGILLSFYFFLYHSETNKFITTAITFAHLTLASIWKRIWEACEILKLKHGSIALWYSIVILFFSLSFEEKQIYHNGKNFCAFDASFDLKKDLRSLWNSEAKTWFHCFMLFYCHSIFFSFIRKKQIYHNGKNFCAFDASVDLKKDLRSFWNSDPKTWFHVLLVFFWNSIFFSIIPRQTNL